MVPSCVSSASGLFKFPSSLTQVLDPWLFDCVCFCPCFCPACFLLRIAPRVFLPTFHFYVLLGFWFFFVFF
uniref:Uncharacterized protein n=1 Tax=Anguilla anguilla TaxID=7936 RepID=A0A0E9PM77_ANGAN